MFKIVAVLAFAGVASAGYLGYGVAPAVAIHGGHGADVAALNRNAAIQAAGAQVGAVRDAANINGAVAQRNAGAAVAAANDQAAQNRAAATLAAINAESAARNAHNAAAITNFGIARDASIQSQQVALARAAAATIVAPAVTPYGAYGVPAVAAPAFAYGGLGAYGAYGAPLAYAKGAKVIY